MCRDVAPRARGCRNFKVFPRFLILYHPRTRNGTDLIPVIKLLGQLALRHGDNLSGPDSLVADEEIRGI